MAAALILNRRRGILADEKCRQAAEKLPYISSKETHYEETIPMKLTWHGNKGWSGYLTGKNSTPGGDR